MVHYAADIAHRIKFTRYDHHASDAMPGMAAYKLKLLNCRLAACQAGRWHRLPAVTAYNSVT